MTTRVEGATPHGGVVTTVDYFDADGNPVDAVDEAVFAEITELDADNVPLFRQYGMFGASDGPSDPVDDETLDEDSTDWIKGGTWDLYILDGEDMAPVTTLDQLLTVLDMTGLSESAAREQVAHLLVLPSWKAAPAELKAEVNAWLESTRPGTASGG